MIANLVSLGAAESEMAAALHSDSERPETLRQSYAAEVIRSYLALRGGSATLTLTNRLRTTCAPLFGDAEAADDSPSRDNQNKWYGRVLASLKYLGDVAQYGSEKQHHYCGTATRLISVAEGGAHMLIAGGYPITVAERQIGTKISCFGYARYVPVSGVPAKLLHDKSLIQNIDDWVGVHERSLATWTEHKFSWAQSNWSNGPPQGAEEVDIYVPENAKRRWMGLSSLRERPAGIRFGRCRIAADEYSSGRTTGFLALLAASGTDVIISHSAVLAPNDTDRMVFGMDLLRGTPIRINAEISNKTFRLTLLRRLPTPERKIITLGFRLGGLSDGCSSDRQYEFPIQLLSIVERGLQFLGIGISYSASS